MKSAFKYLFAGIFISIGFFIYTGVFFDISREELETKYASGNSKFINLKDGSRIHYRDEGDITKIKRINIFGNKNYDNNILLSKIFELLKFL